MYLTLARRKRLARPVLELLHNEAEICGRSEPEERESYSLFAVEGLGVRGD